MATINSRVNNKGKTVWYARVRIKGTPSVMKSFPLKRMAEEWANKIETQIKLGEYDDKQEATKHTLAELIDYYSEYVLPNKGKNSSVYINKGQKVPHLLQVWKDLIGNYLLSRINVKTIRDTINKIAEIPTPHNKAKTKSTLNHYIAALSALYTYAVKELQWIDKNPVANIKKFPQPKGVVRYLSNEEREALFENAKRSENQYLYPIILLALTTGARKNEILTLEWKDVDLDKSQATLEDTKNGERRTLPLYGKICDILKDMKEKTQSKYLFPNRKGNVPINLDKSWYKALNQSNIENFRFHDLRHTCASYLAMNGASASEIADVLGHKSLQMVKRYAHLSNEHKKSVVANMVDNFINIDNKDL